MPSIYNLKSKFQNLLRPLNSRLVSFGITANHVTIAALVLSIFSGLALTLFPNEKWPLLCIPVILFVRMALNAIDGMLAREHYMKSTLGAVLNELGDVVSDTVIYLPFAFLPTVSPFLIVIIVILAIISEMTGVIGTQIGASRRYDGPMGKSDRAFAFGLLAFILGLGMNVGEAIIDGYLFILSLLLLFTIFNRAKNALQEAK